MIKALTHLNFMGLDLEENTLSAMFSAVKEHAGEPGHQPLLHDRDVAE